MKKFYFSTDFEFNYLDGIGEEISWTGEIRGFSVYKPQKSKSGSFLLGFAIIDDEKTEDISITLKTIGDISYYTKVPGVVGKKIMLEAGFVQGYTTYNLNEMQIKGVDVNDNGNTSPESIETTNVRTIMDYSYLALGVSKINYTNIKVEVHEMGKRNSQFFTRSYFNVLMGLRNSIDDVYIVNEAYPTGFYNQYEIDSHAKKVRLGARIGYEIDSLEGLGLGGTLELGYFPGLGGKIERNIYLLFKTRLQLSKILN